MTGHDKRLADLAEEINTMVARAEAQARPSAIMAKEIVKLVARVRRLEAKVKELEERP